MKTFGKMSFGFSVVNAGQRNVSYEPELVAGANAGSFRITPPVSKALLLQHGDNIMFVTNADNIDAAIRDKAPEVVEFCTANGLDIDSMEAAIAIHKEFDMWGIAKGIQESLISNDGNFHLKNRGMVMSAATVRFDNKTDKLTMTFDNEEEHGNIDGGHTYKIIQSSIYNENFDDKVGNKVEHIDQYVFLEIMVDVEDMIEDLALTMSKQKGATA